MEAALEVDDLVVGAAPLALVGESLDALDEHPSVPGAIEHGHPAPTRQRRPEPPQEVVALLSLGRRRELGDVHVAGVEVGGQPPDRASLARSVPALEDGAQRRAQRAVADQSGALQPKRQQSLLRLRQPFQSLFRRELGRQVDVIQRCHLRSRLAVVGPRPVLALEVLPAH